MCRFLPAKAELQLEGFDLFLSEGDEHKRRVAVYINEQLKAEEIKIVSNYHERPWIKLKLKGSDELLVGCIYKSLNSEKEILTLLNKIIIKAPLMKQFSHLLIMGDFNYPKLDWTNWNSKGDKEGDVFMESIRDSFLYQHVEGYTRTRESSEPSIIDLILNDMLVSISIIYPKSNIWSATWS